MPGPVTIGKCAFLVTSLGKQIYPVEPFPLAVRLASFFRQVMTFLLADVSLTLVCLGQSVSRLAAKERVEVNMSHSTDSPSADDPHQLSRFVHAQEDNFAQALAEIRSGRKRTHWMWYVFPQIDGLGFSSTAKFYAIKSIEEARAYLNHPILGPRLHQCAEAALGVEDRSATEIFGSPDDMKLRSCATLFACVSPLGSVFERLLDKYYDGERDPKTLQLLGIDSDVRQN
jgi:uncharacterized protein (DUF1810 family)